MAKEQITKELEGTLAAKRKALMDFRFGIAGSKIKNLKAARTLRREIAQILTKFNSKSR